MISIGENFFKNMFDVKTFQLIKWKKVGKIFATIVLYFLSFLFFSFIKFFVSQLVISFPAHLYLNPTFSKFFFIYVLPLPGILSVKMLNLN